MSLVAMNTVATNTFVLLDALLAVTPSAADVLRVLTLADYNTRVVVIGTTLLGLAAGVVGSFMLLRKRALLGDALSHATLPGIAIAFIAAEAFGATGKSLPVLLVGATVTGALGVGSVLLLRRHTRLKEDTALGVVLSVYFGAGVALLGIVQQMQTGSAAGLESFIYGKTASMVVSDAQLIGLAGLVVAVVCAVFYKEFKLLCFDPQYAAGQGWPVMLLDLVLMSLVVIVTVIGLQAVGLILVIALLIIPAAAARFWSDRMSRMTLISAGIGGVSCAFGAALSAVLPRLPSGAMIVLVAFMIFILSMMFGPARGIVPRLLARRRLSRKVARQHLLRAMYEMTEEREPSLLVRTTQDQVGARLTTKELSQRRSWSTKQLESELKTAEEDNLVELAGDGWRLTEEGVTLARRVTRNHRLWETYLITYADVAPSHVDRDADMVEHVLGPAMTRELEKILGRRDPDQQAELPSPHAMVEGRS